MCDSGGGAEVEVAVQDLQQILLKYAAECGHHMCGDMYTDMCFACDDAASCSELARIIGFFVRIWPSV